MPEATRLDEIGALLRSRAGLLRHGWSESQLTQAVHRGEILRLSRVRYIRREAWESLWPEAQHLARVLATAPLRQGNAAYCLESAAVLHGLPLFRFRGQRAQVMVPNARSVSPSSCIEKRAARLAPDETCEIGGLRCTSLERTLCDLARLSARDLALACIDHALRMCFPPARGESMSEEALAWLRSMQVTLRSDAARRGRRKARHLFEIADGGAESVLESIARLRFVDLGYRVRTQPAVHMSDGSTFYPDFELVGFGVFVEVDGRSKYTDAEMLQDRTTVDALLAEKRREDRLRGAISQRVIRVMMPDLVSTETLARALRELRVPLPRASSIAPDHAGSSSSTRPYRR